MIITQQKALRWMIARVKWVRVSRPKRVEKAMAAGKEGF
jgi:hypothetical protein